MSEELRDLLAREGWVERDYGTPLVAQMVFYREGGRGGLLLIIWVRIKSVPWSMYEMRDQQLLIDGEGEDSLIPQLDPYFGAISRRETN